MASKLKSLFQQYYPAIAALLLMLVITLLVYNEAKNRARRHSSELFDLRKEQVRITIDRRMHDYVQILKGSKGIFTLADSLTRNEWQSYFRILDVEVNYPGIQGIGFAAATPLSELDKLTQRIWQAGYPNFEVVPAGKRDFYTPIILLEPFSGRNLRAFGYDMWSEPRRRDAMQRARDTNAPALTTKVILVQEAGNQKQPGFLLYLPVYKTTEEPATVAARRENLKGFVYSPFRASDLFTAQVGRDFNDLDIEIYDGNIPDTAALLFDKSAEVSYLAPGSRTTKKAELKIPIAGQVWTVGITTMPGFHETSAQKRPYLLLTGLLIISFLIFFILISLLNKRKSNKLKQIITDNATAALFMMDDKGYCTFMNPAAEVMTGFTFDEIKQKPLHEMVHHHRPDGSVYPIYECPIDRALPTNNAMRAHEDVFIRKDGTFFEVSCAASPIFENGQPVSTVVEVRDITEFKEAERKIRENAEQLQKVFYHVPAIVGLISASDLLYVLANPMFIQLFGERQLLGKTIEEAHPELKDQGLLKQIVRVIKTGETAIGNEVKLAINRYNTGELSTGYFNYVFQPVFDDEQRVESVLVFAVEVTELVKSREALTQVNNELLFTNEELQRKNIDLDNFVYVASHDLKSPITNIEGLTHALQETLEQKLEEDELALLKMLETSVNKLRTIVHELTEITKVQERTNSSKEPLTFVEVTQNVLSDISALISESGADIITSFEVKEIKYARKDLRSIIYNLVSNAIRYRAPDRTPQVTISTTVKDGKINLHVQDNGLGIPKSQQHKLFGMFTRLHHHVEGSGTGLYIVKRIVENNGGRILVESEPGIGSTFTVRF